MAVEQFSNAPQTTITEDLTDVETDVDVASASGFPAAAQYRILIDSELMLVTAGAGTTTWTVTRGVEGTANVVHSNGATVTHVLTAAALLNVIPTWITECDWINEIQGWPPYVPDNTDLVTGNLWFRDVGTPTTKATVIHVVSSGLTETYERAIKCITDAASEGFKALAWTYVDQPRIKLGRSLSARCYIWCVGGVGVTAKLVNSDASETAAAKVTAAAWTLVEIPNHTLAGTSCDLQFLTDGAGTFYVAELCANIGPVPLRLPPRPSRFVSNPVNDLLNNADSGGAFVDLDVTPSTSPLTWKVCGATIFSNSVLGRELGVRLNGSASGMGRGITAGRAVSVTQYESNSFIVPVDDGQIFEYGSDAAAGETEHIYLGLRGYWEWA
jgi:hypothetical protein